MKRINIIVLSLMSIILICSCSKQENQTINKSQLQSELYYLESDITNNLSTTNDIDKGLLSKLGKACAVAGADIVGVYEGAKIGGKVGAIVGTAAGNPAAGAAAAVGATAGAAVCGAGASYSTYKTVSDGKSKSYLMSDNDSVN